MRTPRKRFLVQVTGMLVMALAVLVITGCAARKNFDRAENAKRNDQWEEAVRFYSRAVELEPDKPRYKIALERTKLDASQYFFKRGKEYANSGLIEDAAIYLNKAIMFDPSNQYAIDELGKVLLAIEKHSRERDSGETDLDRMQSEASIPRTPRLHPLSDTRISFYYKDTSIKTIYEQLGKVAGINTIFDKQIQDQDFSIDVQDVTFEEILNILTLANGHFIKVIDETTVLIIPDNQAKRKEYEDQVIKTFYLSSADIKDVQTLLRTVLGSKSRTIAANPELNAITIVDTPRKVALASKIIESNDKNKSEVVVDIELLEVNRKRTQTLGIELTSYTIGQSLNIADEEGAVNLNDLRYLDATSWNLTLPAIVYNFLKTDSDTKLIAKPQLRVAEGEKASIHIGDKVPIPTTTFNFTQTDASGTVVPVTSYTYQNVGIQIEVEPRVHHNHEITLILKVEVSSLGPDAAPGQPTIGNREISTVIRLKDGETNLLAGLVKEDYSHANTGVPGISDIPFFKKFLGKNEDDSSVQDIVLTITPHIVRIPNITEEDVESIYLGMVDKEPFSLTMEQLYGGEEPEEDAPDDGSEDDQSSGTEDESADEEGTEEQDDRERRRGGGTAGTSDDATGGESTGSSVEEPDEGSTSGWGDESDEWLGGSDEWETDETGGGSGGGSGGGGDSGEDSDPFDGGEDQSSREDRQETSGGPITVSTMPTSVQVGEGMSFVITVSINDAYNVGHVPFHILFNPQVLEFVSASEGNFMNSDGRSTSFRAAATDGRVLVGLSRLGPGEGAEGSGTLAAFEFRGLAAGASTLSFSNNSVQEPGTRKLPSIWVPGQVTVR